jgi:hypothetical protein
MLPTEAALAAVTIRLRAAGVSVEGADSGLLVRDPSENAVLFKLK